MSTPAVRHCPISGLELTYKGRGRPPKYHPSVKAELAKQRRAAKAAKGA